MNHTLSFSAYAVLGVLPSASSEEIREAYQQIAERFRDEYGDDSFVSRMPFKEIHEAAVVLLSDDHRPFYDEKLMEQIPYPLGTETMISRTLHFDKAGSEHLLLTNGFLRGIWAGLDETFSYTTSEVKAKSYKVEIKACKEAADRVEKGLADLFDKFPVRIYAEKDKVIV